MKPTPPITAHLEHGVFMVIHNLGILIRGQPGIGKSTLALELIDRGHILISDDIVQFKISTTTIKTNTAKLIGSTPAMLQNLLAIRDIGVLDISLIYTAKAIITKYPLDFIIQLDCKETDHTLDITNPYKQSLILGYKFPIQKIFAHANRNLALIVETAIKNYILYRNDQDAGRTLMTRQQQYL